MVLSAKGIALRGERARAHSGSTIAPRAKLTRAFGALFGGSSVLNELAHAYQREGLIKRK